MKKNPHSKIHPSKKKEKKAEDKELDKALEDTFPASDATAKY